VFKSSKFWFSFFVSLILVSFSYSLFAADETLTITTYYPSPYGSYKNLTAPGVIGQIQNVTPTTDITTTSTVWVDMDGMSITLTTRANSKLLIFWSTTVHQATAAMWTVTEAQVDGTRVGAPQGEYAGTSTISSSIAGNAVGTVATAGSHTVKIRWKVAGGTAYCQAATYPDYYSRTLTVVEVYQ
jgi:hypothetical protein